jgi:hypothetical protein
VALGKTFSSLLLVVAGVVVGASSAAAAGIGFQALPTYNDLNFQTDKCEIPSSSCAVKFEEDFVYEGRFANNATNGNVEMFINNWATNQGPATAAAQAQYKWSLGQPVPFTLSYNGTTANFNVNGSNGNTTISASNLTEFPRFTNKPLNAMYLRTRSNTDLGQSGSSMTLNNIKVSIDGGNTFTSYGNSVVANDADPLEYLLIVGLNQNFIIQGDATFVKGTSTKTDLGSKIAFQFKAGWLEPSDELPVPEPASLSLLSLGMIGTFASMRRKK